MGMEHVHVATEPGRPSRSIEQDHETWWETGRSCLLCGDSRMDDRREAVYRHWLGRIVKTQHGTSHCTLVEMAKLALAGKSQS